MHIAHQTPQSIFLTSQARILEWVAISFSRGSSKPWSFHANVSPALQVDSFIFFLHLFCLLFFFFFLIGDYFTILWFCHTFTWISHVCICVPHPDPPSHTPPHPIPQGHLSAPALSTLPHASNLDWRSISYMIIYMFQCYSLKSSHPCLLPQSPTVCSLCVSFAVLHIGSSLPSF